MTFIPHIRQPDCNVISSLRIGVEISIMVVWPSLTGHFIHLNQDSISLCLLPDAAHSDW